MRLDRNTNGRGRGKYALIKLRKLADYPAGTLEAIRIQAALDLLRGAGILDYGDTPETEFFVMRLKDRSASSGLFGYANEAQIYDPEYAGDVAKLAMRAGPYSPFCKKPD